MDQSALTNFWKHLEYVWLSREEVLSGVHCLWASLWASSQRSSLFVGLFVGQWRHQPLRASSNSSIKYENFFLFLFFLCVLKKMFIICKFNFMEKRF